MTTPPPPPFTLPRPVGAVLARLPAWPGSLLLVTPLNLALARQLPQDVKDKVTALTADLWETNPECAYGVAAGEAKDFVPVTHDAFAGILEARKLQDAQ